MFVACCPEWYGDYWLQIKGTLQAEGAGISQQQSTHQLIDLRWSDAASPGDNPVKAKSEAPVAALLATSDVLYPGPPSLRHMLQVSGPRFRSPLMNSPKPKVRFALSLHTAFFAGPREFASDMDQQLP